MSGASSELRLNSSEPPPAPFLVHSVSGPPGTALAAFLAGRCHFYGEYLRPLVGPFDFVVADVSAPDGSTKELADDLPAGEARAEGLAVRLRRQGIHLERGEPRTLRSPRQLESLCYSRGRSSLAMIRADFSLVTEMQVGAWFQGGWRGRLVRRVFLRVPWLATCLRILVRRPGLLRTTADVWFWAGVRREASSREWRRLTRSSYVALCYHRLAGKNVEGEEELDVAPRHFERQMRALRILRFHPLSPSELHAFHADPTAVLPRRRYVVTADDAYADTVVELERNARLRAQVFAPTALIDEASASPRQTRFANWEMLNRARAAGVAVGSHSRHHVSLTGLDARVLSDEISGSLRDLKRSLPDAISVLAYPYGNCDEAVREATSTAGYEAAFTTSAGRNGAGTDRWCLHRIGIQARNTLPAFLWKVVTGEPLPGRWERRLVARETAASRRRGRRE